MMSCPCPPWSREKAAEFEAGLRALEAEIGVQQQRQRRGAWVAYRVDLGKVVRRLRQAYVLLRSGPRGVTLSGKLHDEDEGGPVGRGGS